MADTDSVCFVNKPEKSRFANSTPGTRFSPSRSARIESLRERFNRSLYEIRGRVDRFLRPKFKHRGKDKGPTIKELSRSQGRFSFTQSHIFQKRTTHHARSEQSKTQVMKEALMTAPDKLSPLLKKP